MPTARCGSTRTTSRSKPTARATSPIWRACSPATTGTICRTAARSPTWPGTTTTCPTRASPPTRCGSAPNNHSNLAVSFLGTNIPANTPGPEALRIALDRLFNHANTGPFFARQMIQRLVTSNPSPAYVGRVAAAFANNGAGVRGDLKAVWTAILTDTEARTLPGAADTLSGKLREPVVRLVQWARTVGITSTNGDVRDLRPVRQRHLARSEPAAFAVGVQFLPPGLRAAEHGHRHRRQAGAGIPAAQRNHDRGLHQLHAGHDAQRLLQLRREPDLRRAAAHRARRAGGDRLAESAAHGEPAFDRDADGACKPCWPHST